MTKLSADYEEGLRAAMEDPAEAAAYLNAALEDGSRDVFLLALRDVAVARGLSKLAREAELNRENLYRMLSEEGTPQFSSSQALLDALGFRLSVEPKGAAA